MDNPDFDDHTLFENFRIPKSTSPEDVLESFVNELKSPLTSIKGWVEILSIEANKDLHPKALDSISTTVARIERVEKEILDYLKELKAGS